MKVTIYKGLDGELTALVQASPGKGRAPVLLHDITEENIKERVLPVIQELRGPKSPRQTSF